MERKIRPKNGSVGYINSLINNEMKSLCETFEPLKTVKLLYVDLTKKRS